MAALDSIQKTLLEQVADLHEVPQGAYSLLLRLRMSMRLLYSMM